MPKMRTLQQVGADYPSTAPVSGTFSKLLPCSADTAFRCFEDGAAWKKWLDIDVEWTSPQPFGVGTTRTITANGQTIEEYFTAWEQGRLLSFRFERATLPLAAFAEEYLLVPKASDVCELRWSYGFAWGGPLASIAAPIFKAGFTKNANKGLTKLVNLLETEGDTWSNL